MQRCCYELGRSELARTDERIANLRILAEAARKCMSTPDQAFAEVNALAPFATWPCEELRLSVLLLAARRSSSVSEYATLLAELKGDSAQLDKSGLLDHWYGGLRYRQGRYAEARDHYVRSAKRADSEAQRFSRLVEALTAAVETGDFEHCRALAAELRAPAKRTASPLLRADVERLERLIAYRQQLYLEPDLDLVAASRQLGTYGALVAIQEAAFAWRYGHDDIARQLCRREAYDSIGSLNGHGIALLMTLIGAACTTTRELPPSASFEEELLQITVDDIELQARAFLARLYPRERTHWLGPSRELAQAVPAHLHAQWLDVLSVDECLEPERIRLA